MNNIINENFYENIIKIQDAIDVSRQKIILVIKDTNKTEHYGLYNMFIDNKTVIELQYQSNKYFTNETTIAVRDIVFIQYFIRDIY